MTELCKKFEQIIANYRNGLYGDEDISLGEILRRAKTPNLFKEMDETELKYLFEKRLIPPMLYSHALETLNKRNEALVAEARSSEPEELNPIFDVPADGIWCISHLNPQCGTYNHNKFETAA